MYISIPNGCRVYENFITSLCNLRTRSKDSLKWHKPWNMTHVSNVYHFAGEKSNASYFEVFLSIWNFLLFVRCNKFDFPDGNGILIVNIASLLFFLLCNFGAFFFFSAKSFWKYNKSLEARLVSSWMPMNRRR